jgi:hypothetical protein
MSHRDDNNDLQDYMHRPSKKTIVINNINYHTLATPFQNPNMIIDLHHYIHLPLEKTIFLSLLII